MSQTPNNRPKASEAEIRRHYYLDRYVIIAPKRGLRPDSFSHAAEPHVMADADCPFCRVRRTSILGLPTAKNWRVLVFANDFPALTLDNPAAFGTQEVALDTPDHTLEFSDLPVDHIELIFEAYRRRIAALKSIKGIRYVLVFKNDGPTAGSSVAHAHAQIYGLPLIPPRIEHDSQALNHYYDEHGTCAVCDLTSWEEDQRVRVIASDKHLVVVSPYAAASGFEAWLIPRRHFGTLADFTSGELTSLATMLKKLTAKLDAAGLSFNYFLQETIDGQDHHFMIKLEPRVSKYAGAELATGIDINPVPPEYAALWYQNKA